MELRQLKYFLAVADTRSLANAASANFISRQAISKAIAQLEAELGMELFVRDSNGTFLTPAGVLFYDRIRSSVLELEQVRSHMLRYSTRYQQRVRLAFCVGTVPQYEEALQTFMREQSNLILNYWEAPEAEFPRLLRERKADIAFSTEMLTDSDFEVDLLRQSPYGVLLQDKENLRSTESLTFEDLSWIPLAGIDCGSNRALCEKHRMHMRFPGFDTYRMYSLTRAGQCAMLCPKCLVPGDFPGLRWFPLENVEPWKLYTVCLRSLENNVLYRTAIDELLAEVFEPSPEERSLPL